MRTKLNENVLRICREHWGPVDAKVNARCIQCPIHDECTAPSGNTSLSLARWVHKCNDKANQVAQEKDGKQTEEKQG